MEKAVGSWQVKASENTPKIVIAAANIFEAVCMEIAGESFPENSQKFYAPVFQWLKDFNSLLEENYASGSGIKIKLNFRMDYFNSSTAKIFIMLMEELALLKAKHEELTIAVNWYYNDEDVRDAGEEIKTLVSVPFNVFQNGLQIEETGNSPLVIIDTVKKLFEIQGKSSPENAGAFYAPVMEWIELYGPLFFDEGYQFNFKLSYFDSPSENALLQTMKKIEAIQASGKNLTIQWHCDDSDAREEGAGFASKLNIAFRYIETLGNR